MIAVSLLFGGFGFFYVSPTATAQVTASVGIQSFTFTPGSITVVVGVNNTVTWTNHDTVDHTVTADDGSFNSTLTPGATFTHTFTAPGTFTYHCSIHPYMKGSVTVLGSGSTSSLSSNTSTPSGSGGGIPEFPLQGVTVAVFTALVLASYLVLRQTKRA